MAMSDLSKKGSSGREVKVDLKASDLKDFEYEIAKSKILEAAYNHIKLVRPENADFSFSLSFDLGL